MVVHKKKKTNERRPYIFVEWWCSKERINERGTYTFVEWLYANKRKNSVWTLIFGQMVLHKREIE